ncbi:hypothetical protein GCM10009720_21390 [Yaniella flava]|uniref:Uncharacterized protein n=1 Tax=Yaniella flava TaxID=287930 RepID=A0ABN2UQ77_9MICC
MTNTPQHPSDQSDYTAISPRPLGEDVSSAYISTFDGKHYAHAITHHNFHPAVPSEYLADKYHDAEDVQSYLDQRDHVIEGAVREWHGDKTTVRTVGPYEYDQWSKRYEFTIEINAAPTEANAILALLEVDPGYLAGDTHLDEHVMDDLRAFDQLSIPNSDDIDAISQMVFANQFLGLYLQEFEDTIRRNATINESVRIEVDPAARDRIEDVAIYFYRRFEGDITAWQTATEYSLAGFAFAVAKGDQSNLADLRSFDLPEPKSYELDEHVISVRLERNMVEHLPKMTIGETFHITQDGTVTLAK